MLPGSYFGKCNFENQSLSDKINDTLERTVLLFLSCLHFLFTYGKSWWYLLMFVSVTVLVAVARRKVYWHIGIVHDSGEVMVAGTWGSSSHICRQGAEEMGSAATRALLLSITHAGILLTVSRVHLSMFLDLVQNPSKTQPDVCFCSNSKSYNVDNQD